MKTEEKKYIIWDCYTSFQIALQTQFTNPYKFFMNLGKARGLKKIIEEFIDCQSEPYYSLYQKIVKLSNELGHIAN